MDDPHWLTETEDRAWRGYRRMRTLLDLQIARDLTRESGLSEADYDVLSNLSETEGHRQRLTELAARMLWSQSRLSHHITRMQHRGLVTREDCAADGRGSFVVLTPEGLRAIDVAAPGHVASVRKYFIDLLTRDQVEMLATVTSTVVDHLATSGEEPPHQPG
jgi:DNA-binding MarR family transcriptional regulator